MVYQARRAVFGPRALTGGPRALTGGPRALTGGPRALTGIMFFLHPPNLCIYLSPHCWLHVCGDVTNIQSPHWLGEIAMHSSQPPVRRKGIYIPGH